MFELFDRAGVTDAELSRLCRVSRAATHGWRRKGTKPSKWVRPLLDKIIDAVQSAVDAGDLPLSKNLIQSERVDALPRVIRKHLQVRKDTPTS